ncbi:MAG: hypothetical protein BKPUNTRY_001085 [Candidatus Fervidibacter sp.]
MFLPSLNRRQIGSWVGRVKIWLAYGRIAVGDTEGCGGAGKGVSHDGANACF